MPYPEGRTACPAATRRLLTRRAVRAWLGAAALAASWPARAAADQLELHYDFYWGALRLLAMESHISLDHERYRMRFTIRTTGAVGLLFPWQARSESTGLVREGSFVPARHVADSVYRRESRHTTIDYGDDGALQVRLDPPPDAIGEPTVPAALRRATVDPNTATLTLVRGAGTDTPCAGVARIFDGRRRYDLRFTDRGPAEVPPGRGTRYAGPARLCEAVFEPIAGFKREDGDAGGEPIRFRYWFAPVLPGRRPLPARIDISGPRGTVKGYLTEVRAAPAD